MHLVHALRRSLDRGGIANVAGDELDVLRDVGEPPRRAARIVVEHAHAWPALTSAFTSAEPMKPLPPVTRMRLTRASPLGGFARDVDPGALLRASGAPRRSASARDSLRRSQA